MLAELASSQWSATRGPRKQQGLGVPSGFLLDTAGARGETLKLSACEQIQQRVHTRLSERAIDATVLQTLMSVISTSNIAATAFRVLRTPELLYLPQCLYTYLQTSRTLNRNVDIDAQVLQMCFCSSHMITANFHHVWDVEKRHQNMVRPRLENPLDTCTYAAAAAGWFASGSPSDSERLPWCLLSFNVHCMQARYLNRPTHLNFFLTSGEAQDDALPVHDSYRDTFSALLGGHVNLPDNKWVFLLCDALTMLVFDPQPCGQVFREFKIVETRTSEGRSAYGSSSTISLARWCHRISLRSIMEPFLPAQTRTYEAIDPLAAAAGCERIMWARDGEVESHPQNAVLRQSLRSKLRSAREPASGNMQASRYGSANASTSGNTLSSVNLGVVTSARTAIRACSKGRFRSDDAFAGKAYCAVLSGAVDATPVAVMPDFACRRTDRPWQASSLDFVGDPRKRQQLTAFTMSQGSLLSMYHQFRLNLLLSPENIG